MGSLSCVGGGGGGGGGGVVGCGGGAGSLEDPPPPQPPITSMVATHSGVQLLRISSIMSRRHIPLGTMRNAV